MISEVLESIRNAEKKGVYFQADSNVLTGFSGEKLVGTLQRLASLYSDDPKTCYLEVGVFQGLTLLSVAAACPKLACYGIDNFTYFDPDGRNMSIVKQRTEQLGVDNSCLINEDYEDALESLDRHISDKKIALYFIDGPHDYRSQLMCLALALPYLHDDATIIIDDCNYRHVRQANRDFLVTHPEFKLVFEAYTKCHPGNMTSGEQEKARKGWWNGVNILIRDPDNSLQAIYPPTERNRTLYENEHIVHAAKHSELAPQALKVMQAFSELNVIALLRSLKNYLSSISHLKSKTTLTNRFNAMNTYSETLTSSRRNTLS